MNRTLAVSLVLVMVAIVGFACGGGDSEETSSADAGTGSGVMATLPSSYGSAGSTLPEMSGSPTQPPAPAVKAPVTSTGDSVVLEIGSVSSDGLEFDTDVLAASAGAEVALTFKNNAVTQQHNWVLVKNGTKDAVATAGLTLGADNGWIPPDDPNVIANAGLIAPGESAQVTFTAPSAGTYQFVCTFPGHNLTMFGTFEVNS